MRILYASTSYKPAYRMGGPTVTVTASAEALVRKGHEVTVFTSNTNLDEELDVPVDVPVNVDGVQVWYFKPREYAKRIFPFLPYISQSIGFLYSPRMKRELDRLVPGFDLVHTQSPFVYPTYASSKSAAKHAKPLFYHQHGSLGPMHLRRRAFKKRLYVAAVERPILRRATTLIALTQAEVESYRALGVDTPIRVVPNGVDVDQYRTAPAQSVDARLGLPEKAAVVLFMGRLHATKGVDALLEAFLTIRDRIANAVLVLAGPDENGLEAGFRSTVARAGVGEWVRFPGMVTGDLKLDLLARADLFVLPSHAEGFSMAVLEALASATPVLISPGCSFPEVEAAGVGRVVPNNPESLAEALPEMLSSARELADMGRAGRQFVLRNYTWDRVTDSLLEVYQEGVARHRRAGL